MAEPVWMSIKAAKQGDIKSEVTTKGREGMLECLEFNASVVSPYDPASGHSTGKRMHKPLEVRVRVGKASPLLSGALVTNETLTTVKLQFYRPDSKGATEQFYTIELTNAVLVEQEIYVPMTLDKEQSHLPAMERLAFIFQKIVYTYTNGGVTAQDDWEAPT